MTSVSSKKTTSAHKEYGLTGNAYYLSPFQQADVLGKPVDRVNTNKIPPQQQATKMGASRKSSSKAKSQFNYSRSGNSNYTSFRERIEKACTTNSTADLQKENMLLSREIERLQKQIFKKDQQIIEMRTQVMPSKETKAELFQLYRALNYFEGKIKEMENQIYKFRDMILKAPAEGVTVENLNVLFEDLRRDNQQLSAQIEQSNYLKLTLQDNFSRLKTKYYESQRELAEYKRRERSPLHEYYLSNGIPLKASSNPKITMIFNQMMSKNAPSDLEIKQRQMILRELEGKLEDYERKFAIIDKQTEKLHLQIDKLRAENLLLQNDLEDKSRHMNELFKDYMSAKKSLKNLQSIIHTQKVLPKNEPWTPSFKNTASPISLSQI